jgi:hypothetical protein
LACALEGVEGGVQRPPWAAIDPAVNESQVGKVETIDDDQLN